MFLILHQVDSPQHTVTPLKVSYTFLKDRSSRGVQVCKKSAFLFQDRLRLSFAEFLRSSSPRARCPRAPPPSSPPPGPPRGAPHTCSSLTSSFVALPRPAREHAEKEPRRVGPASWELKFQPLGVRRKGRPSLARGSSQGWRDGL